jgi:hypothetical protein
VPPSPVVSLKRNSGNRTKGLFDDELYKDLADLEELNVQSEELQKSVMNLVRAKKAHENEPQGEEITPALPKTTISRLSTPITKTPFMKKPRNLLMELQSAKKREPMEELCDKIADFMANGKTDELSPVYKKPLDAMDTSGFQTKTNLSFTPPSKVQTEPDLPELEDEPSILSEQIYFE